MKFTFSNVANSAAQIKSPSFSQSIDRKDRVLIVDDLIATGGTAKAAMDLVEAAGGTVVGFSFVMGLRGLDGLDKLGDKPSSTLVSMPA